MPLAHAAKIFCTFGEFASWAIVIKQWFVFYIKMWQAKNEGYDVDPGHADGGGVRIFDVLDVYPELKPNAIWLGVGVGGILGFGAACVLLANAGY